MSIFRRKQQSFETEKPLPISRDPAKYANTQEHLAAAIANMQRGLRTLNNPAETRREETVADYNFCLRKQAKGTLDIIVLQDGFALHTVTESPLLFFSHRLKVPTETEAIEYHREAFDVDIQCLTPDPLNLIGIEQINEHKEAVKRVFDFEFYVMWSALTNWKDFQTKAIDARAC